MPEESSTPTQYTRSLTEITQIPAPDDLVQSPYRADIVTLASAGTHSRGELLMSSDSGFIPATAAGLTSAPEIAILCENISITEGTASVLCYFTGKFSAERLILPYEQEDDDHSALIENIRPTLRAHGVYLV